MKATKVHAIWLSHWKYFCVILGVVFITYLNSLFNAFVSDDLDLIQSLRMNGANFFLQAPFPAYREVLLWSIYQMFGESVVMLRLPGILFHAINAVLVYGLLYILFRRKDVASLIAVLFAVHPLLVEATIWISANGYPMYTTFSLLCILTYILARRHTAPSAIAFSRYMYGISLGSFFLASVSEKALLLPCVLVAYELCFGNIRAAWKVLLPFFGIVLLRAVLYLPQIATRATSLETNFYVGTAQENILLKVPFAVTRYLQLFVWPDLLTLYHAEGMSNIGYIARVVGLVAFVSVWIFSFFRSKMVFFGLTLFVCMLAVVLLPLKISSTVAERYVYFPSVGLFVICAWGLNSILKKFVAYKPYVYAVVVCVICVAMMRTIIRNADWATEYTFWSNTVKTSPNAASVHNNMGVTYAKMGNIAAAEQEFRIAAELNPIDADVQKNLGYIYMSQNRLDEAAQLYQKSLELNPTKWSAYNDLGAVYMAKKEYATAEAYFTKALQYSPQNAFVYFNLGRVYALAGEKEKSLQALKQSQALDPTNAEVIRLIQAIEHP